jgi:hypothetical protein
MKNITFKLLGAFLIMGLIFTSCEKAETPDNTVNPFTYPPGTTPGFPNGYTFSYKKNGNPVTVKGLVAQRAYDSIDIDEGFIQIAGSGNEQALYLVFDHLKLAGVHPFDINGSDVCYLQYLEFVDPLSPEVYNANGQLGTSEMVITTHDRNVKLLEGTFEAKCEAFGGGEVVSITEGKFKVYYGN